MAVMREEIVQTTQKAKNYKQMNGTVRYGGFGKIFVPRLNPGLHAHQIRCH
jgi:hypothetical protein